MNDKPKILIVSGESFHAAARLRDLLESQIEGTAVVVKSHEEMSKTRDAQIIDLMATKVIEDMRGLHIREPRQPAPWERRHFKRKKGRS